MYKWESNSPTSQMTTFLSANDDGKPTSGICYKEKMDNLIFKKKKSLANFMLLSKVSIKYSNELDGSMGHGSDMWYFLDTPVSLASSEMNTSQTLCCLLVAIHGKLLDLSLILFLVWITSLEQWIFKKKKNNQPLYKTITFMYKQITL